jgi:UPF0716 protein FxsA
MWLLVLFIGVPLIEIALFIQVGGWLTLWPTLGIVVATAILGTWLVRQQGLKALDDVQRSLDRARDPMAPIAHGVLILFAGALLLTPGFLTDAIGFMLLVPAFRVVLLRWILRYGVHHVVLGGRSEPGRHPPSDRDAVIDAEFRDITPAPGGRRGAGWAPTSPESGKLAGGERGSAHGHGSGWTRH